MPDRLPDQPHDPPPEPSPRFVAPLLVLLIVGGIATPFLVSKYRIAKIGENEAAALRAMRAYAQAQENYFKRPRGPGEVAEYAQTFEPLELNMKLPPLDSNSDYYGYRFAVLTAQDNSGPGGAMSFLDERGRMTKGFGLLAVPARYGISGRNTYLMTGQRIYYVDFGIKTSHAIRGIREFSIPPNSGQIQ